MSRRAIRRYQEELDAEQNQQQHDSVSSDDESEQHVPARQDMFALLGDQESSSEDDVDEEEQQNQAVAEEHVEEQPRQEESSKKKKKKRRKKKKKNVQVDRETDPDWVALEQLGHETSIPQKYFSKEDDEHVRKEAERIIKELEQMLLIEKQELEEEGDKLELLWVDHKLLNCEAELRRMFGRKAVKGEIKSSKVNKKNKLVTGKEGWWPKAPGLVMEEMESIRIGERRFEYIHEGSYAKIQQEYRQSVEMMDVNGLMQLVGQCGWHVDGLLQAGEVYREMGEVDRSAEMVERALYVLENSWCIGFKPWKGDCRLSFESKTNRGLHIALFRYAQLLSRRGLHRTALEISKLGLCLDVGTDSLGVLLMIDSYGVLSGEYSWVERISTWTEIWPLDLFPNFAMSRALSLECLHPSSSSSWSPGAEALTTALLTFPMVLRPLVSCTGMSDELHLSHRLYDSGWYSGGEDMGVLERMCGVYAERSKALWTWASGRALLARCAEEAGRLDAAAGTGTDAAGRRSSLHVSDSRAHARVETCRTRRTRAARWLAASGLYDSVMMADFADGGGAPNVPPDLLGAPPPAHERQQQPAGLAQLAATFLHTALPWNAPE